MALPVTSRGTKKRSSKGVAQSVHSMQQVVSRALCVRLEAILAEYDIQHTLGCATCARRVASACADLAKETGALANSWIAPRLHD